MTKVVSGNAVNEGVKRWGWFMGHFITPSEDPRSTEDLEVKWAVHKVGDSRTEWAVNNQAATLCILLKGQFRLQFEDGDIVLYREGDYVLWCAGVPHCWVAESECTIVTVRWPSKSGDSVGMPRHELTEHNK